MKQADMKEIVIISGKGGTGKTTVTASLAAAIPGSVIIDADVDAANLHLLLKPKNIKSSDFTGKAIASINRESCISCDRCRQLCRFHAIDTLDGYYRVDNMSCDGCGLCQIACPAEAIEMNPRVVGKWFTSETNYGDFVYARLTPGAENSGSLVTKVKQEGRRRAGENGANIVLTDGPPGIGCPVIAAVSGAHLAVVVTEPTYSGISDLERVFELIGHFKIPGGIVINRSDINMENTRKIEEFARRKGTAVYAAIPHSRCVMEAIANGEIPGRACKELARQVEKVYKQIIEEIKGK